MENKDDTYSILQVILFIITAFVGLVLCIMFPPLLVVAAENQVVALLMDIHKKGEY